MKILIVTMGGITHFFRNWPERLLGRALVERGHTVTAYTYRDLRSEAMRAPTEEVDGVRVKRFAPANWYSTELAYALAHDPRPDVVQVFHLRNTFSFQTARHFQSAGVPVVMTPNGLLHDPYLVADRDRPYDAPLHWENLIFSPRELAGRLLRSPRVKAHLKNYFMHAPMHFASARIAISRHEHALLREHGLESELIPQWIDEPFVRALVGKRYPTEFPRPVVLFIAQFKYRKGFDVLSRAMPLITAQFPQATFVFVSHNPARRAELEAQCRANGTIQNLRVIERVTEEDKVRLYNSADVLAFPTRYEGFGLPLLEAMAAGCPVVSSCIPVVDEIVTDAENGLLVPRDNSEALGQAITRVIQDRALRDRLVANGFETLKRFDPDALVTRTEGVYRRVARD